ncbi:MAG TPA: hypothetical protein VFX42_08330 [Gemmatimonadales bacterium]|nr:hypothetical protein [Gemmatimonadales bacterium]
MSISPLAATFLLLTSVAAEQAVAQRRVPGQPTTESTEVMVVARLGSKSYSSRVPGTCKYEPSASIYDVPAALWMVEGTGSSSNSSVSPFGGRRTAVLTRFPSLSLSKLAPVRPASRQSEERTGRNR